MMTPDGSAGLWGVEPMMNSAVKGVSNKIDAALRRDRLEYLRNNCSVLIVGDESEHCNKSRHQLARTFCKVLAENSVGVNCDASVAADTCTEICMTASCVDGTTVNALSFATNKRNKESQLRIAAADPTLLIYVVSVDSAHESKDAVVKALKKSLANFLFLGSALGNLKEMTICVVLANCASLRDQVRALEGDETFFSTLKKYFPSIVSNKVEDILLGIGQELEEMLHLRFYPKEVRTIYEEESLLDHKMPAARILCEQMLAIVQQVQNARLEVVEKADMSSSFENTIKEADLLKQQVPPPKQQKQQKQVEKLPSKSLLTDPAVKITLFFFAILIVVFFLREAMQEAMQENDRTSKIEL